MERTILLIEDDPDVTRLATAYLEREGYRVAVERDGEAGLLRYQLESSSP
jgi:DNA-binding response OmpR family regulator